MLVQDGSPITGHSRRLSSALLQRRVSERRLLSQGAHHPERRDQPLNKIAQVWDYESGDFEVTLKGHTKAVCDVDYDSKGLLIGLPQPFPCSTDPDFSPVSCSSDLTLKLWDTSKSHQCIKTLHDHDHSVSGCRFVGPADAYVVSASRDSTIKVWEVSTS